MLGLDGVANGADGHLSPGTFTKTAGKMSSTSAIHSPWGSALHPSLGVRELSPYKHTMLLGHGQREFLKTQPVTTISQYSPPEALLQWKCTITHLNLARKERKIIKNLVDTSRMQIRGAAKATPTD